MADPIQNDTIEHTRGGITTRSDANDVGVPMRELAEGEKPRRGPEDALDPNSRGDYSERLKDGPSIRMDPTPVDEREEKLDRKQKIGDGKTETVTVTERKPNATAVEAIPGTKVTDGAAVDGPAEDADADGEPDGEQTS